MVLKRTPHEHWRIDLQAFLDGLAAWEAEEEGRQTAGKKVVTKSKRKTAEVKVAKKSKYVEDDDGLSI